LGKEGISFKKGVPQKGRLFKKLLFIRILKRKKRFLPLPKGQRGEGFSH